MATLSQELKRLYKVPEVARILDTPEQQVYSLIKKGILPAVHLGRQVRIDRVALDMFIESGGQAYSGGRKNEA